MYQELLQHFHNKTLIGDNWYVQEGCERNKFDEIQIFLKFIENKKEPIMSVDEFLKDFKYKENDLHEPQDIVYKKQGYQITYGDKNHKGQFEQKKNNDYKSSSMSCNVFSREKIINCDLKDNINMILQEIQKITDKNTILLIYLEHIQQDFLNDGKNFKKTIEHQKGWRNLFLVMYNKNIQIY